MTLEKRREIYLNRFKNKAERASRQKELELSDLKVEKMKIGLRVHFKDLKLKQSLNALSYLCEKKKDFLRNNGELYIIHPLSMACRFQVFESGEDRSLLDDYFATLILHDMIEDIKPANRPRLTSEVELAIKDLPVGSLVQSAVRLMTISALYPEEEKSKIKLRYYNDFISQNAPENIIATKCKGFDRWDNMTTITALPKHSIYKNVLENQILLLPTLEKAGEKWPHEADILFLLGDATRHLNDLIVYYNGFDKLSNLNDQEELFKLLDNEKYHYDLL